MSNHGMISLRCDRCQQTKLENPDHPHDKAYFTPKLDGVYVCEECGGEKRAPLTVTVPCFLCGGTHQKGEPCPMFSGVDVLHRGTMFVECKACGEAHLIDMADRSKFDELGAVICQKAIEDNLIKEKTMKIKRPDEALAALGELFRSRNAVYGSTYKDFGAVMRALIPGDVKIETEAEWNRLALFFHCADKLARYGRQFKNGGHADSLDDVSVYAQLLQECDAECRERKDPVVEWPMTTKKAVIERPAGDKIETGQPVSFSNPTPSEEEAPTTRIHVGNFGHYALNGEFYWIRPKNQGHPKLIAAVFVDYEGGPGPMFSYGGGLNHAHQVDIISWIERPKS